MKKPLVILFCLSMSYCSIAQEPIKIKEVGLVFSNLDNFGLTFKTGTEKSLWRFNSLFISGSEDNQTFDSTLHTRNDMGFGIKIGKEYRKTIVDNLELRLGGDVSFTYNQYKSVYDDLSVNNYDRKNGQTIYRPGINFVFGLNYVVNDQLVIGAELLPGFSYTTGTTIEKYRDEEVKTDISGFNYGLSNNSVLLSLSYRF